MANLGQLVYQLPKQGAGTGLSTLHSLSQQKKGASNRYGRVPSLVSQFHGAGLGNFAAAPMQNAASGGSVTPATPPAPVAAPVAPAPSPTKGTGADPGEIGGFTIGKGQQGLLDQMSQTIGIDLAKGMFGRGINKGLQTSLTALAMDAPLDATLDATMNASVLGMLGIPGLAKGLADAGVKGSNAVDVAQAVMSSGILGQNTPVEGEDAPPMGTVASNVAQASLANSPNTAKGALASMFGFSTDPSATDVTNDTIDAAMKGMQNTSMDKGISDPVTAALFGKDNALQSMMKDHFSQEATQKGQIDTPTSLSDIGMQGFDPMSIGFSDTPSANEGGFSPMGLGGSTPSSPDMGGFSPMGFGNPGDSSGDEGGISPMGLGPVGPAPGVADGGDGGGGDGGTVICTELHRQGLMPDDIYKADSAFGRSLDDDTIRGYHMWGKPVARAMRKSPLFTWIIKPLVLSWAHTMAGRQNRFWSLALKMGIPVCRFIGRRNTNTELIYE